LHNLIFLHAAVKNWSAQKIKISFFCLHSLMTRRRFCVRERRKVRENNFQLILKNVHFVVWGWTLFVLNKHFFNFFLSTTKWKKRESERIKILYIIATAAVITHKHIQRNFSLYWNGEKFSLFMYINFILNNKKSSLHDLHFNSISRLCVFANLYRRLECAVSLIIITNCNCRKLICRDALEVIHSLITSNYLHTEAAKRMIISCQQFALCYFYFFFMFQNKITVVDALN
jgi:hypothetical protein